MLFASRYVVVIEAQLVVVVVVVALAICAALQVDRLINLT